nr:MAG TPA: hypothetical protein [Caudoviricetes sp.]
MHTLGLQNTAKKAVLFCIIHIVSRLGVLYLVIHRIVLFMDSESVQLSELCRWSVSGLCFTNG